MTGHRVKQDLGFAGGLGLFSSDFSRPIGLHSEKPEGPHLSEILILVLN